MESSDFCPAGDPAVLERGATAWADLASTLTSVKADLDAAVRAALPDWTGPAADAFERFWTEHSTILTELAAHSEEMASTLEDGAGGVEQANRLYQSQVAMMWIEVNAAIAPMLANPFTMLAAPGLLAAVNAAMVELIEEAEASFVSGAAVAVNVIASTTVAVGVGVIFAPAGAAVEAAAATMVTVIESVFAGITITIETAVTIIQVAVQAIVSAMTTLLMGIGQSAFTHTFVDGSPVDGWTGHEIGALAIETTLSAIPMGALVPERLAVQMAVDIGQSATEAVVMNAYEGGELKDAITLETVLTTGLSIGTSHVVSTAMTSPDARAASAPPRPIDLPTTDVSGATSPRGRRKPLDQQIESTAVRSHEQKPRDARSIDERIDSRARLSPHRAPKGRGVVTDEPSGSAASPSPSRRPRADAVAAEHPPVGPAPARRRRAGADAGRRPFERLVPGEPRRASAAELLDAAERSMTPGQLRELKEAFASSAWSYGTTGEASPSAAKDAVESFLAKKEAARKAANRWRQNAENKKAAREGREPKKITETPSSLYWPGARAVEIIRNGRQMMDNYYGQGGTTMHEARDPVVGAWLHQLMGFEGDYDHSRSGRDTYLDNYGGDDRKGEGWMDPAKGRELFQDEHGNTLSGTKEMSRLIREGVQRYGGMLVIDGKNVVNDSILQQRQEGAGADWTNLTGLRDTNVEMRALLPFFAEHPGQSKVAFGEGELVFQWGGKEVVPTQELLLSSWTWAAPKRGGKYGTLTMDQAKKVIPADSPFWKLPVDDAAIA